MKTKHFLPFIAIAIGMGSCTNDLVDETNPLMGKRDVIAVSVDNADTRTAMNGNSVVWSTEDAIGIFVGNTNNEYVLQGEGGTSSGNFQSKGLVVASAETLKEAAYFPYVQGATWANNVITTTLPETYEYAEGTNNNAVMAALMAEDAQSSISFQNAGALYAITVENIPAGYNQAVMTYLGADDKVGIAGAATITFNNNGEPTLAVSDAADAASAQKTITINFTTTGDKTFYFPMPVKDSGYANKLQFSLRGEGKDAIEAPVFTKEPVRSKLYAVSFKLDNVNGDVVTETSNIDAANTELAKDAVTSVAVNDATADTPITIPAKSTESAAVEHTIDLSKADLPTTGSVVIVVTEGTGEKATVEKLTVIVPEGASAGSYNINAPGTTVTIQSASGTVIETIEATTAENTLIIGAGVTVNSLTINKGNVVLEDGASVGKFIVKDAAGLNTAIALGGKVELSADIENVSELLRVEKDLVLDLNGYTLAFTPQSGYPGIKNTAKFEVKDSKATGKITSTQVGIQNNGTLVINCDVETVDNAINNVFDGETTINGGTYKNTSTEKALIYSDNNENGTPVLTINGGTFESVFTNVSYNNYSTGSVNGGTFICTGGWHNIYVGGEIGGCNVTYAASECSFTSNGVNVQVNNWGVETNKNTLNGVEYSGVHNIVYASELSELKTAVAAGGAVVLTSDVTGVSDLLRIEKDLVLDLNGYTLAFTPQSGYPGIKNTAKFEVKDSKATGKITSTQVGIQNNGTLVINCDVETVDNAINNVFDGETTINGGTYKNTSTEKALIYSDNNENGTPVLTINGGTFESVFTNVSYNNYSTGSVNGGTFICTGGWHNIYVGGEIGGCNVTYAASECSFTSNGIKIQVNDWDKGNTNTVNETPYSTTVNLMQ